MRGRGKKGSRSKEREGRWERVKEFRKAEKVNVIYNFTSGVNAGTHRLELSTLTGR